MKFYKIDVDKDFDLVSQFEIKQVPTFITYFKEDLFGRFEGIPKLDIEKNKGTEMSN